MNKKTKELARDIWKEIETVNDFEEQERDDSDMFFNSQGEENYLSTYSDYE